jgi:hypothetical protein
LAKAELRQEICFQVPDGIGVLARVMEDIAKSKADITVPHAYGRDGRGKFRVVSSTPQEAIKAIKSLGYELTIEEVIAVTVANKPGESARITRKIADAGVSISYAYLTSKGDKSYFIIKTNDNRKALEALNK